MRLLLLLLVGCTAVSDATDGVIPAIGDICECDFDAQYESVAHREHYEICSATTDQTIAFEDSWTARCLNELDAHGGGGCFGGCTCDHGNLCTTDSE